MSQSQNVNRGRLGRGRRARRCLLKNVSWRFSAIQKVKEVTSERLLLPVVNGSRGECGSWFV